MEFNFATRVQWQIIWFVLKILVRTFSFSPTLPIVPSSPRSTFLFHLSSFLMTNVSFLCRYFHHQYFRCFVCFHGNWAFNFFDTQSVSLIQGF